MSKLPKVGELFSSRYQLLEVLGQGGGGTVYKALQVDAARVIALKILRQDLSGSEEFQTRFLREAQALNKIQHPNVVVVYHCGIGDMDMPFVAMELVEGLNVRSLLDSVPFIPALRTIHIIRQAAAALAYVHKMGIVHRDLKPENIVLVHQPQADTVKLIDFGMARLDDEKTITESGAILGTVDYISPEQATGKKIDQKSDVYSLCICLFEMFTGVKPFNAESPFAVIARHLHDPVPVIAPAQVDRFHQDMNKLLGRGLAKAAEQRFANMTELVQALDELANVLESVKPRVPQQKHAFAASAPKTKVFGPQIGVIILICCLTLGATFLIRGQKSKELELESASLKQKKEKSRSDHPLTISDATAIDKRALSTDFDSGKKILDTYLNSKHIEPKARAILLISKAFILMMKTPEDSLTLTRQALALTEKGYKLNQDDVSLQLYLFSAYYCVELLLEMHHYQEALELSRNMLAVPNELTDRNTRLLSIPLQHNPTAGDFLIDAALAAKGKEDFKQAKQILDGLNASYPGYRGKSAERVLILLALKKKADLVKYINLTYETGMRPKENFDQDLYAKWERFECFKILCQVAESCVAASEFELADDCYKKAAKARALLEYESSKQSKNISEKDWYGTIKAAGTHKLGATMLWDEHVRNVDTYVRLSTGKLDLYTKWKKKERAKKEAADLYEWWLKENAIDYAKSPTAVSYLQATQVIIVLLESGEREKADRILELVIPHSSSYCGYIQYWDTASQASLSRLLKFKDDPKVQLLIRKLS